MQDRRSQRWRFALLPHQHHVGPTRWHQRRGSRPTSRHAAVVRQDTRSGCAPPTRSRAASAAERRRVTETACRREKRLRLGGRRAYRCSRSRVPARARQSPSCVGPAPHNGPRDIARSSDLVAENGGAAGTALQTRQLCCKATCALNHSAAPASKCGRGPSLFVYFFPCLIRATCSS